MIFTSWEETGRDDHTPIPSESPAVNFTSASLRLQPTSEGALHVLWMRWRARENERGGDDGYGVITPRWKRRREELSCGLCVDRQTRQAWHGLMVHVHLGEPGKHITTPPPRDVNTQTQTY